VSERVVDRAVSSRERWGWYGLTALVLLLHLAALTVVPLLSPVEPSGDLQLFFDYERRIAAGEHPYRDFTLEYPPLAALAFWLPTFFGGTTPDTYRLGFAIEMIVCDLLAVSAALWAWRRCRLSLPFGLLILWPFWLLMAGQSLALERFDLWPAALVVVALALALGDRPRFAWLVIGLGAASKLYPLLLAPLLLLTWKLRSRRQLFGDLLACALAIMVSTAIVTRGDPLAVRGFVEYHLSRGLEIESLLSSLLLLGRFFGHEFDWVFRYGSIELLAPLAGRAAALTTPLTLLGRYLLRDCVAYATANGAGGTPLCSDVRLVGPVQPRDDCRLRPLRQGSLSTISASGSSRLRRSSVDGAGFMVGC